MYKLDKITRFDTFLGTIDKVQSKITSIASIVEFISAGPQDNIGSVVSACTAWNNNRKVCSKLHFLHNDQNKQKLPQTQVFIAYQFYSRKFLTNHGMKVTEALAIRAHYVNLIIHLGIWNNSHQLWWFTDFFQVFLLIVNTKMAESEKKDGFSNKKQQNYTIWSTYPNSTNFRLYFMHKNDSEKRENIHSINLRM